MAAYVLICDRRSPISGHIVAAYVLNLRFKESQICDFQSQFLLKLEAYRPQIATLGRKLVILRLKESQFSRLWRLVIEFAIQRVAIVAIFDRKTSCLSA